ncbi:P-loop containing nucleoside triphosphate hydrolase protein [Kalaharituber pfeilii]|nr:P-loop containing nucleoside triphosphate hydrolase protein [Kalaharituber pfeilii]
MAEAVGFAIGIVGLVVQLAEVSRECSNIFSQMEEIGEAQDIVLHNLRTEGLRLKQWEKAWGLDDTPNQQLLQLLDPNDERYTYAVASLARIVAIFAKVAELQARYQSKPEKVDKSGKRDSLRIGHLFSNFRSKSPNPGDSRTGQATASSPQPTISGPSPSEQSDPQMDDKSGKRDRLGVGRLMYNFRSKSPSPGPADRATSPSPQPTISGISLSDLRLLENPKILSNTQLLPGLEEEIASLRRVVNNVQQSVSAYRKLRWASSDKAKCHELVTQLTNYIDGLFKILPPDTTIPRMSPKTLELSFDIPFSLPVSRQNCDFVGREYLLEELQRKIKKDRATMDVIQVVLYGMGGVGKTQLALEYTYRHRGDFSAVFWINAASENTTKLSFAHIMQRLIQHHAKLCDKPDYTRIGRLLGMAGKLDSVGMFTTERSEEQHIVNAVKEWLAAKDNTKWLLVFDNRDDLRSFNVDDYIPSSARGTVIITSRRREIVHGRKWLEVEQMQKIEAEELLFKSAKRDLEKLTPDDCEKEKQAAAAIVQKLGYLPLAIDQAGAYIYALDSSFSRYYIKYEDKVTYLLSTEWKVGTHDRAVFAAWDLSFNAIQEQNANAAELLLLCGFLDNNDICEELLQRGMKLPIDNTSLKDSIWTLFLFSMAKRKDRDDSFSIHPIVHKWAQWKLNAEPEKYNKKATEALLIVTSAIAVPTYNKRKVADWIFERRILSHIIALEKQAKTLPIGNQEILMAVDNLGAVYKRHGYYRKAEEMYKLVLARKEKTLGTEHSDTLSTVNNIAVLFRTMGQYDKALEYYQRALVGREKALGTEHPDTLTTVNNIAVLFRTMGQYDKALEYFQRALVGREKALGTEHPDTLTTVNNIAVLFRTMGQYDKALEYFQRALVGREKALGTEHPDTLTTVNCMANLFHKIGQSGKAQDIRERTSRGSSTNAGK